MFLHKEMNMATVYFNSINIHGPAAITSAPNMYSINPQLKIVRQKTCFEKNMLK